MIYLGGDFVDVAGIDGGEDEGNVGIQELLSADGQLGDGLNAALIDLDVLVELEVNGQLGVDDCGDMNYVFIF